MAPPRVITQAFTAGVIIYLLFALYLAIASVLTDLGASTLPLSGVGTSVVLLMVTIGIAGIIFMVYLGKKFQR